MGGLIPWPGWGKTAATCNKDQDATASITRRGNALDGVVKLLAEDSKSQIDPNEVSRQVNAAKAKGLASKTGDMSNVKIVDMSARQGQLPPPIVTGENTAGSLSTDHRDKVN